MARSVPPHMVDLTKLAYDPMYDENGNIVLTVAGKPISAKLTPAQHQRINELVLEGNSLHNIATQLRTTKGRVEEYLNKPKTQKAIEQRALTVNLVQAVDQLTKQNQQLVELIAVMERRISSIQIELKQVRFLAYRQKTGRLKAEKESRTQKKAVTQLRRDIWKRTGKDPLV